MCPFYFVPPHFFTLPRSHYKFLPTSPFGVTSSVTLSDLGCHRTWLLFHSCFWDSFLVRTLSVTRKFRGHTDDVTPTSSTYFTFGNPSVSSSKSPTTYLLQQLKKKFTLLFKIFLKLIRHNRLNINFIWHLGSCSHFRFPTTFF